MTWRRVLELQRNRYTPVVLNQWLTPLQLFERPSGGAYVLRCRTGMQAEMVRTRFYEQLKMDLAIVVREHVELEVTTL